MGRTVLADESANAYVTDLFNRGQWQLGLIVGQLTQQKDFAVRLICSPEPVEDEASEDDDEPRQNKKPPKPDSMADCDERWICTHARQVTRMLPGGLDVIGIFALAPPNMMQCTQTKLRQILYMIHKNLSKGQISIDKNTERYLLQICSSTRKFTCRTIDVADPKSSFRPADWKPQTGNEKWIKLQTNINIDLLVNVPNKQQNQSLLKQIQQGIVPYCENISNAMITINGNVRDLAETLDQSATDSKKGKGRDKGHTTQQVYDVDFYTQPISTNKTEPVCSDCVCKMAIQGITCGRAYVHSKAIVSEAKHAITTDIIRSIQARCELLCEDIEVVEDEGVKKEIYDTPVRVFGKLSGSNLDFCDYKFQDEKLEEVTERIKELLDLNVEPDSLELDCEQVPSEELWTETKDKSTSDSSASSDSKAGVSIMTIVAGGLAVVAAGLSYLFIGDS